MSTSVHDILVWKHGWKLHHKEIGSYVTKTRDLGYAHAGAKRSAIPYQGKYHYIYS